MGFRFTGSLACVAIPALIAGWSAIAAPASAQSASVSIQFSGRVERQCQLVQGNRSQGNRVEGNGRDGDRATSGCSDSQLSVLNPRDLSEAHAAAEPQIGRAWIWEDWVDVEIPMIEFGVEADPALDSSIQGASVSVRRVTLVPQ